LEERVGEGRPATVLDAAVGARFQRVAADIPGLTAENDGLLSLPLSSKGGEGNGAAVSEHRDPCKEQGSRAHGAKTSRGVLTRRGLTVP